MFEIIGRDGTEVHWRFEGLDGVSVIFMPSYSDHLSVDSFLCCTGLLLSSEKRNEIKREVLRWLEDTGEKEKLFI